jgi:hypothetical protein
MCTIIQQQLSNVHLADLKHTNHTRVLNKIRKVPSMIDPPQGNICSANKDNGEKCYNQRLPSSLYCKQHST